MTQVYMHAGPVSHIIYNPLYYCNNRQKLGVTCIICNSNHVTEEAYIRQISGSEYTLHACGVYRALKSSCFISPDCES